MVANWSNLPEELLNLITVRLFSIVELQRFRSICTSWRRSSLYGVDKNNPFPRRGSLIQLNPIAPSETLPEDVVYKFNSGSFLLHNAFFRVTLSSSTSKGWIIKSDLDIINSGRFYLLDTLSRGPLRCSSKSLDLLEFTVSEIREAYVVVYQSKTRVTAPRFERSVLVNVKVAEDYHHGVLGIGWDGYIHYWDGNVLRKLLQMGTRHFSDIIVHKGVTCVLDSHGIVWCISSDLELSRYGTTSLDETITNGCWGDMRFVECSRELYVVERLPNENPRKRKAAGTTTFYYSRTVGFKVYKMDEELGKWIEVKTLGDKAFLMTSDTCFSVLAHEFYGCLKNSIYFTEQRQIKLFKLDNGNGSIITSKSSKSSFQMFSPSFL
ncbi:probable F-box protein At1g65740 [Capsella rubella]|uniref:probable F-box protein At1g65740 n=1 Tax=Capsella rubella TaxID=81985 RepID=UPI000CD4DBF5|nr:probable F-box protein At1g65740 [Capsella rubella]